MDNLKTWLIPLLEENGCELYDLEWDTAMKPSVLRVIIEKKDGPTDLDACAQCSDVISARLDETDEIPGEYMLEVCSPGAERELKTPAQIEAQVGKYVFVKLKNPQNGVNEATGELKEFKDGVLTVAYFIKGRPKKLTVDLNDVALIMSAVKI